MSLFHGELWDLLEHSGLEWMGFDSSAAMLPKMAAGMCCCCFQLVVVHCESNDRDNLEVFGRS